MAEAEATITRLRPASSKPDRTTKTSKVARLTKVEALAEFQAQPELASNISATAIRWGVSRGTVRNWVGEWTAAASGTAMAKTTVLPPLPVERPAWRTVEHHPAVTHSPNGWWNAIGRGIVGIMLIGAGVWIVVTSMEANAWQGHAMTVNETAGNIFAKLSVLAEFVASVLPTANQF